MAQADGSIRIEAIIDSDSAEKELHALTNSLNESAEAADGSADKLKNGLAEAAKVAATALAAATTAVVAFAKSSIDVGARFDSSMSQVAATMGTTVDEIQDLREFALEMGSNTAFSASQAADALNYMALAGYDAEQSMEMLPNVLNLAAAGGMELAAASDMVTDSQTALGLTFDQTNTLVDQMAKTASTTNTSVSQLGEAILSIGGTAKGLAGGTNELNAVLGVLADNGIKGSEAGTHLRNIMLAMNPTTEAAAEAFSRLGINAYDSQGNLRNLDSIFGDLSAAMADMTAQERTDILSDIFNTTDLTAVNALLSTTTDRWGEVYTAIENASGAAGEMANTQLDNLAGDITLLQSAIEGAQISLADRFMPVIRELVQRITDFVSGGGIDRLIDAFINLSPVIAAATAAFVAYKAATAISGIIDTLRAVTESQTIAQALLNAVMNANPFVLVATAIAALVAGLVVLWSTNEDFRNAVTAIWENIKGVFSGAWESIKGIWDAVEPYFSTLWDSVKAIFSVVESVLKGDFSGAWDAIKGVFSGWLSYFQGLWENIQGVFSHIADWFGEKFSAAWQAVKDVFSAGGKIFDGIKDGILNGLKAVINALIGGINKVISIPFNGINGALSAIRSVNILGVKPFSWISTISIPQIPKLAQGAVIPPNREFLAVLGDQKSGTNIETPLSTMKQAFLEAMQEKGGMGGGDIHITVELDGRVVARQTVKHINDMTRQTGKPVLLI